MGDGSPPEDGGSHSAEDSLQAFSDEGEAPSHSSESLESGAQDDSVDQSGDDASAVLSSLGERKESLATDNCTRDGGIVRTRYGRVVRPAKRLR